MAIATHLALAEVDAASARRAVADAIERLRALELPAGEAWAMREVALAALRAVAIALFTDAHAETGHPGALAGLVAEEVGRIGTLPTAQAEPRGTEPDTHVVVGRWRR
jgi:hypothetical protein